jgi:hypothetical protein
MIGANSKSLRSLALLALLLLLLGGGAWAASSPLSFRLPALAKVLDTDGAGDTWRESGETDGGLVVARGDFERCLTGQGWRLERSIPMGHAPSRSLLQQWRRGRGRIMVMLWETTPGKTGFAWNAVVDGQEKTQQKNRRP